MVAGTRAIRAQAAVLALVLGGGLLRVATYDPPSTTQRLVSFSAASAASRKASTSRFELTVTTTAPSNSASFTMSGETDFAHQRVALTMDLSSVGRGVVRMVGEGNVGWVEVPASALSLTGGKHWITFTAPGGAAESLGGDPSQMLDRLARLGDQTPRAAGQETVRGVTTTRYHLDLTLEQLARMMPAEQADAIRDSGAESILAGTDVWIDDAGLPRRIELTMDAPGVRVVTRGETYDYGAPVHIELPSASDSYRAPSAKEAMAMVGLPTP